jgi:hypothetical protein
MICSEACPVVFRNTAIENSRGKIRTHNSKSIGSTVYDRADRFHALRRKSPGISQANNQQSFRVNTTRRRRDQ